MATICAVIANANRGKTDRVFQPADFLPKFGEPEKPDEALLQARLKLALRAASGALRKKPKGVKSGNARPRSR